MKFTNLNGETSRVAINPDKYKRKNKDSSRSISQWKVGQEFQEMYPHDAILEEFPIPGERLFLDFFIPARKIAVEVHGKQHEKYNPFFHGQILEGRFERSKENDERKKQWCKLNGIELIII